MKEHSLEVQLPFIKFCNPDVKFVPVTIATHSMGSLEDLGIAVASAVKESEKDILIIASSDMSHYVSQKDAEYYDKLAIDKIEKLDYKGLMQVVEEENISMCGAAPVTALIKACNELGAKSCSLVHYNTSAETSGDTAQVVGYAGMTIV
jgi:AmmeMemoRadiSam system protein B